MKSPLNDGALRAQFTQGKLTVGTFLGLNTPLSAEIAALAGFDWVLLDLEHGASSENEIGTTVVAAGAYAVPTLVRVDSISRIRVGRALDAGASGVMVPQIKTVEEAREVVSYLSYPPNGVRGVATYNRSAGWGNNLSVLQSGRDAACILQIETISALNNVEDIAAVEGVDVLFVGPLDLSFALGVPRDFTNPLFIDATKRVIMAAQRAGKVAGILASDSATAQELIQRGFKFIALGSDSTILAKAYKSALFEIRNK